MADDENVIRLAELQAPTSAIAGSKNIPSVAGWRFATTKSFAVT